MKNDHISFKILSVVILAGVVLALVAPDHVRKSPVAAGATPVSAPSE
jgi:hypothetical protein